MSKIASDLVSLRSIPDVAEFFETSVKRLNHHLYRKPTPYRTFHIKKKSGGMRVIEAPPVPIIFFQKRLARALSDIYVPKPCAHGFVPKRSVVSNAEQHLQARMILNLDLNDFFHSIHFGRVLGVFCAPPLGLPRNVAALLAHLCCHDGKLPQGAPTSPVISNFVCRRLDSKLRRFALSVGARYTRYADDITISTRLGEFPKKIVADSGSKGLVLGKELVDRIVAEDFSINPSKSRLLPRRVRQEVTGITVNQRLNVEWEYVRSLRAALNCWEKQGYQKANARFQANFDPRSSYRSSPTLDRHLDGKLNYLSMVRGKEDRIFLRYKLQFAKLSNRCVTVVGEAASDYRNVEQAVWVLVGLNADGDVVVNGSAVNIEGLGFVTNNHVIDPDPATEVIEFKLLRSDEPTKKYDFDVVKANKHLDIAVLSSNSAPAWAALAARQGPPIYGEVINLFGFPSWFPGHKVRQENGQVTQLRNVSARRLVQVSCSIQPGNSGGPVLGSDGRVIAIATYDDTSHILRNGCVDISDFL